MVASILGAIASTAASAVSVAPDWWWLLQESPNSERRVELGALLRDPDQIGVVAADADGKSRPGGYGRARSCAGL
jgi:hypothetical protein